MLRNWFEDDTNTLADLAYTLEGMKMTSAADYVKRVLEPVDKMEDISEWTTPSTSWPIVFESLFCIIFLFLFNLEKLNKE